MSVHRQHGVAGKRRWKSCFGASPEVMAKLWALIDPPNNPDLPANAGIKHLLWGLMWLRTYGTEEDNVRDIDAEDEKTFRKWAKLFVEQISLLEGRVIKWEDRRINDILNDAMASVDGTDFLIENMKPFWSGWYCYKTNHAGLRYEVCLSLRESLIVWIHGPFPPGRWNDLSIFRHSLISHLDADEKVEADDGYAAERLKTLTPKYHSRTQNDAELRQHNRNRQETINKRFKDWNCLRVMGRHGLLEHSTIFRAVAVICQLAIQSGEPVFADEYDQEEYSLAFSLPV